MTLMEMGGQRPPGRKGHHGNRTVGAEAEASDLRTKDSYSMWSPDLQTILAGMPSDLLCQTHVGTGGRNQGQTWFSQRNFQKIQCSV